MQHKVIPEKLLEPAMRQAFADGMRLGRDFAETIDPLKIDEEASLYAATVAGELLGGGE